MFSYKLTGVMCLATLILCSSCAPTVTMDPTCRGGFTNTTVTRFAGKLRQDNSFLLVTNYDTNEVLRLIEGHIDIVGVGATEPGKSDRPVSWRRSLDVSKSNAKLPDGRVIEQAILYYPLLVRALRFKKLDGSTIVSIDHQNKEIKSQLTQNTTFCLK